MYNTYLNKYKWRSWLRHYATSQKVTGSSPDEVDFLNYLILQAPLWPWGRLTFLQKWVPGIILWGKEWPARIADKLTAICEPTV
jgi:hypothetical protein